MSPTVGRIVLYRLERPFRGDVVDRPAIIVEPWSSSQADPAWRGKVNLVVFLDGTNDGPGGELVAWRGSVERDDPTANVLPRPNTWRWPPRS